MEEPGHYGGGGGVSPVLKNYFYLIIRGDVAQTISDEDIKSFFNTAVKTGEDHVFIFLDISHDQRLGIDLRKLTGGAELYNRIENSAPVFLISRQRIPDLTEIKAIEVLPITDYAKDIDAIYEKIGMHSRTIRLQAIAFLKRLNEYAHLRPNIFGIGINLNEPIKDMIARLERSTP
jgi:hypothetical protein